MKRFFVLLAALAGPVLASVPWLPSTAPAAPPGLPYPEGYRSWTHVKSMVIDGAEHPLFESFGGLHNVYVNAKGGSAVRKGGPYPDGTVFVFDLFDIKMEQGAILPATRKFIGVMVKDSKKYAATGGWGWDVFKGDSRTGGNVQDAKNECFGCHEPQSKRDFVFSEYQK